MTDWHALRDDDYAVPQERDVRDLVRELSDLVASPDPGRRDDLGYAFLATWLGRGVVPREVAVELGDVMTERLRADEVWVRSFASLVLDALVTYGTFETRWVAPFVDWYAAETDLRGHDAELGWLHAVAHGADLLGTFGRHPEVDPATMLRLAARRLCVPSDQLWRDAEDERLGHAIALTLTHPDLAEADALAWIEEVERSWASVEPGPPPAWVSNAARTLRVVVVLSLTGVRAFGLPTIPVRHREPVRARLLDALHALSPHLW